MTFHSASQEFLFHDAEFLWFELQFNVSNNLLMQTSGTNSIKLTAFESVVIKHWNGVLRVDTRQMNVTVVQRSWPTVR